METSIRFLRIENRAIKPVLCFRGRNQAHAVINDETCIRAVSHIPVKQHDDAPIVMGPVGLGMTIYPIDLFVKKFEEIGKRKGMTLRAEYFLKRALEGGVADNESLPPDTLPGSELPPQLRDPIKVMKRGREINERMQRTGEGFIAAATATRRPDSPKPGKPSVAPPAASGGASRPTGGTLIARIAAELKLEPPKLRKLLRAAGLSAPYDDERKIRGALK